MPASSYSQKHAGGRLDVLFTLARGGMSTVELAVFVSGKFTRLCVLKRLHKDLAEETQVREMFLSEARFAGLLRSTYAAAVTSVGEDARGPFLVMDYVEGCSAAQLLSSLADEGELLPVQLACKIVRDAARGLSDAHSLSDLDGRRLGLVHRDIAPPNILLSFDGTAKITDFGVAAALESDGRTRSGVLRGRIGYLAPERLLYQGYDYRADLFALGVVFYELLAAARYGDAKSDDEAARLILHEAPPDIGMLRDDIPAEVVELLFELLAKDALVRPQSSGEVARRLDLVLAGLQADEGVLDLGGYLRERFEEQQEELRERIALERRKLELRSNSLLLWLACGVLLLAALLLGFKLNSYFGGKNNEGKVEAVAESLTATKDPNTDDSSDVSGDVAIGVDDSHLDAAPPEEKPKADKAPARTGARGNSIPPVGTKSARECNPPFYFDEAGKKRVKRQCF